MTKGLARLTSELTVSGLFVRDPESAPPHLSLIDLGVRWLGSESYRILSFPFSVRWNSEAVGDHLRYVLGDFRVPESPTREGPAYSVVDVGSSDDMRYQLWRDGEYLYGNIDLAGTVGYFLWHINAQTMRRSSDFLLIHAGAVRIPDGGGILLPAPSGSGKTTLVVGLVRAGFNYLSDEAGAIDPATNELCPYARAVALKLGSAGLFPELRRDSGLTDLPQFQWHARPSDIRPDSVGSRCQVRHVVFPKYQPGASARMTSISRADAVAGVARNAINLRAHGRRGLQLISAIVPQEGAYRLEYESLADAVALVSELSN